MNSTRFIELLSGCMSKIYDELDLSSTKIVNRHYICFLKELEREITEGKKKC